MKPQRLDVKFTEISEADGHFTGYGAIFDDADQCGDVIRRGAFAKSLAEHEAKGTMPAMLWQHDAYRPIGVWKVIQEDLKGLRVEGQLVTETADGAEAAALMKAGALGGLSIGYRATHAESGAKGNRELLEVDLWEISLVTFPMQPTALIDTKALSEVKTIREMEAMFRDRLGLSQSMATGMVSHFKSILLADREGQDALDRIRTVAGQVTN